MILSTEFKITMDQTIQEFGKDIDAKEKLKSNEIKNDW